MIYSTKLLRAEIGRNIHASRVRRRLVLAKVARASGVAEEMIDRYELGKNEIRLDELLRVACVLVGWQSDRDLAFGSRGEKR